MATDSFQEEPAQCEVPNITLSSDNNISRSSTTNHSTPGAPVVVLTRPREQTGLGAAKPTSTTELRQITLVQRPLSAPTSLTSSHSPAPVSFDQSALANIPHTMATTTPVASSGASEPSMDVDASIVQALKSSKDRLYVLKLGETMENLISQGTLYAKVELQPASSYQRLLVHRCATFYHLTLESMPNSTLSVIVNPDSRIPSKRIAELVPAEETKLPAFQIMRRVDRPKTVSRATSVDGNLTDDGEDTRSQGSGSKKRQHRTIEEREAEYNKARSRIFMDFEEKDASVSSSGAISSAASAVSFTGGSTGMSSVDGDGASTAPTESEYSGPTGRGKESWYTGTYNRGKSNNGQAAPSAALRSNSVPLSNANMAPTPTGAGHYTQEPANLPEGQPSHLPLAPAPAPAAFAPFPQPIYPYYVPLYYPMPYAQQVPPPGQQTGAGQAPTDQQPPPAQSGYIPPQPYPGYVWMPAPPPGFIPIQPPGMMAPAPPPPPQQEGTHRPPSRPSSQASQQSHSSFDSRPAMRPQGPPQPAVPQQFGGHAPTYPGHTPQQPPHQNLHPISPNQRPGSLIQTPPKGPPHGNRNDMPNYNQPQQPWVQPPPNTMPLAGRGPNVSYSGPGRPTPPMTGSTGHPISTPKRNAARTAWGNNSFGPGVSYSEKVPQTGPIGPAGGILRAPDGLNIRVLPTITHDAQSIASSSSGGSLRKRGATSSGVKSSGDEASSVTSSSSSSSKRTFTSTASSQPQHPLPERPDWAIGARPQPGGLRGKGPPGGIARHILQPSTTSSHTPSPIALSSNLSSSSSSMSGGDTMAKEFPPLGGDLRAVSSGSTNLRASPKSVWNNGQSSPARAPGGVGVASLPTRPTGLGDGEVRFEESNPKFDRPPPKSGAALYNPRATTPSRSKSRDGQAGSLTELTSQLESTSLGDNPKPHGSFAGSKESLPLESGSSGAATTDAGSGDS